jgi:hypothetical protein
MKTIAVVMLPLLLVCGGAGLSSGATVAEAGSSLVRSRVVTGSSVSLGACRTSGGLLAKDVNNPIEKCDRLAKRMQFAKANTFPSVPQTGTNGAVVIA